MPVSKNRKKYSEFKKSNNINKQKLKQMNNTQKENPVTFLYHKDKDSVEVPMKAWQTLNQAAQALQSIALFVSTMEIVGQHHMADGTLVPVFSKDLEPSGVKNPDGTDQLKIKDSFWEDRKEKPSLIIPNSLTTVEKPEIIV